MKVCSVDPGYDRLGVAFFDNGALLFSTCITPDKHKSYTQRLLQLQQEFHTLITQYHPDVLAIETLFFSKNQTTALKVAESRGIILYTAELHKLTIYEYNPMEVKVAITGYGKADKKALLAMVPKLITLPEKKRTDDEIDAIAIGLTHYAITPKKGIA